MSLIITLVVIFVALPAFFLFIFVYLPKSIRRRHMRRLAQEFKLGFENGIEKGKWLQDALGLQYYDHENKGIKRNFLRGNIRNHAIEVFDSYEVNRLHVEHNLPLKGNYTKKSTYINIDGNLKSLSSGLLFSGLAKISQIRKELKILLVNP